MSSARSLLLCLVAWSLPSLAQVMAGSYVGDGTADRLVPTTIQPSWVWVKKENSATIRRSVVRTSTMSSGLSKTINSSLTSPVLDAGVLSLEPAGFRVGRSSEVNQVGELYWYFAGVVGSASVVGEYTGDGQPARAISTGGLSPDWVLLLAETDATPTFALDAPDAGLNHVFHGFSAAPPQAFEALLPGGFQVSAVPESNALGVRYHFIAVQATPGVASVGTYAGDGAAFRSVRGLGLFPQWAFSVAPQTAAVQGFAARTTGTELSVADTGLGGSAGILPVPDGFELDGGPGRINRSGDEHVYVALGGVSLLPDGGLLGAPELFSMDGGAPETDGGAPETDGGAPETDGGAPGTDGGAPGTDGGAPGTDGGGGGPAPPLRHQVGCACSNVASALPAMLVLTMLARGRARRRR